MRGISEKGFAKKIENEDEEADGGNGEISDRRNFRERNGVHLVSKL